MKDRLAVALGMAMVLAALAGAEAQRRPDPVPVQNGGQRQPDLEGFTDAYARAGEPPVLVLVGIQSSAGGADVVDRPVATGQPASDRFVGQRLQLFDPAGDALKLRGDIEEILLQNHDIDLVNLDALAERDRREIELLEQRDSHRAAHLMATKTNAELVMLVRMIDTPQVRAGSARYRVMVEMLDVPRGRKIGGFGFDWLEGTDSVSIKRYAEQMTRRMIEQYVSWHDRGGSVAPRRYTVRVRDLTDVGDLLRVRRALQDVEGVSRVREGGFTTTERDSYGTLTISHSGSLLELMYEIQQMAREELGMALDATDGVSGTLTLTAARAPSRAERWRTLVDETSPAHADAVSQLLQFYREQGQPRIAVMINEQFDAVAELEEDLRRQLREGDAAGDRVVVQIGENQSIEGGGRRAPAADRERALGQLLDVRRMEDAVYRQMLRLRMDMVDPQQARARIQQQAETSRELFGEDELVTLLGQASEADIIIHGVGRVDRRGGHPTVSYTFRAVRTSDSATLAAEVWSSDLPRYSGAGLEGLAVEAVAAYVTGNVLDQMMHTWVAPSQLTVTVTGAATQRDVMLMMELLQDQVPQILSADFEQHDAGAEGGMGRFRIAYVQDFESLVQAIEERSADLPFELTHTAATRQTLTMRIDEAGADGADN